MSYSFSVRGVTKAEVAAKVAAEFDKVVASQPIHAADRPGAQAAAAAMLAPINNPGDNRDYSVSVNGSVSWGPGDAITSATVNVTASLVDKA